ncbi:MAG: hypothetical protein IIC81_07415 [Chloroflexi bacterium]|nr:hypothetical protein [Chloroflexota bacterium]
MTVCIAAMCTWEEDPVGDEPARLTPMIVGASDRMLTAGDIAFEPNQTKIADITDNIKALVAGDASVQISLVYDTTDEAQRASATEVKEVAEIYSNNFAKYRREQAELKYLSPLGLDLQSFIQNQQHLSQETTDNINYKLENYKLGIETIITGVDSTGAHIYTVKDPGIIACQDVVGFAAIGVGQWHSNSQFMFKGYTRECRFAEALFITYTAKRRAEVAPGVGDETDMFILDTSATDVNFTYAPILEPLMKKLGNTYTEYTVGLKGILDTSLKDIDQYIIEITGSTGFCANKPQVHQYFHTA